MAVLVFQVVACCNDPTIGSYNNYHLRPNGIPRGSQRSYGLVYLVYKDAGSPKGKAQGTVE